jgi:hypothetical protein
MKAPSGSRPTKSPRTSALSVPPLDPAFARSPETTGATRPWAGAWLTPVVLESLVHLATRPWRPAAQAAADRRRRRPPVRAAVRDAGGTRGPSDAEFPAGER